MKSIPIVQFHESPVLHERAHPVTQDMFESGAVKEIVDQMITALRSASDGVALAAPQISIGYQIFVMRGYAHRGMNPEDEGADEVPDVAFINPEITFSEETEVQHEACLSCRGYAVQILVPLECQVRAQNEMGEWFEENYSKESGSGYQVKICRHEYAHLMGRTVITQGEAQQVFKIDTKNPDPKTGEPALKPIEGLRYTNDNT